MQFTVGQYKFRIEKGLKSGPIAGRIDGYQFYMRREDRDSVVIYLDYDERFTEEYLHKRFIPVLQKMLEKSRKNIELKNSRIHKNRAKSAIWNSNTYRVLAVEK